MSIAEFYIENGIDAADTRTFDRFMSGLSERDGEADEVIRQNRSRKRDDSNVTQHPKGTCKLCASYSSNFTSHLQFKKGTDVDQKSCHIGRVKYGIGIGLTDRQIKSTKHHMSRNTPEREKLAHAHANSILDSRNKRGRSDDDDEEEGEDYNDNNSSSSVPERRPNKRQQVVDCKYGINCQRPNCWYAHPSPAQVVCAYGDDCKRPNCWYKH